MNIINIFIVLLSIPSYIWGQQQKDTSIVKKGFEIDGFYDWTMTGQNISIIANRSIGRHVITFGLKYFINHDITDNEGYLFINRFREEKFPEEIGLNIGYKFNIRKNDETVRPYLFYLLQASYLRLVLDYIYDPNTLLTRFIVLEETQPFYIFENTIGIGLQTRLYKDLYLNQNAGFGIAKFYDTPDFISKTDTWEWVTQIRFGLTYKIK